MTDGEIIDLVRQAVYVIFIVAGPILVISIIVGLIIAIIQTTTSIQEQTLTFVPKIFAILIALAYFSYFIIAKLSDYTIAVFAYIPELVR
ncbi:flagellar biosynthetic protein FliQ [Spirochaetota bacterium]|nr:flagellar biosynthetic protein FliQ [Spirochaetota bacterium]